MTRYALACIALLAALPAAAQSPTPRPVTPDAFAWQWPIDVAGTDGALRFSLTPEIYARITRADLGDLVAFNAANESIPLGPAAQAFDRLALPPAPVPVRAALFRVPRAVATAGGGDAIALHIARAPDGRLTRLDAEVTPGNAASVAAQDVLLDLSAIGEPVTRLLLELDAGAIGDLNARVEVAGSDDLANWRVLASNLAVVSLSENGLHLQRTQLDFEATALPYLRLRRSDAEATLPLEAVQAVAQRSGAAASVIPARESFELAGSAVTERPGAFDYTSAGPFPIETIAIALADRNSVADVFVESRARDGDRWQLRAQTTAFRLGAAGDELDSPAVDIATLRDRHWRVRTEPVQARAPTLTLSYRADQFVLLTQGPAPYRLAAGSVDTRRPDYPMRTVLSQLRLRLGDLWLPTEATFGAGAPLAGDSALSAPPPPPPYKQWLLWGVLLVGAALVIGMVLKLIRTPVADGGDRG
jgi:hypothetical protein